MGEQVVKRITWELKNFSTLQDECYYSPPFVIADWNWHIIAYPKYKGHFCVYIGLVNPKSLPSGWRRHVKFRFSVVNKISKNDTKVIEGQNWFHASNHCWGFREFLPFSKLSSRDDGFLVGDSLIIVAELHVFPPIAKPEETVGIIEPLSNKKLGIEAANASSYQVVQKTENDASQENVDFDVSIKNPCGDSSQAVLDDDDVYKRITLKLIKFLLSRGIEIPSQVLNAYVKRSQKESSCQVVQKHENDASQKNVDYDVPKKNPCVDTSQESSESSDDDGTSKEGSNGLAIEIQPAKEETIVVNGFHVLSSQVESVNHIFKRHPDIALGFRQKNQQIRRAYMNELLSLIEMLCQSPEKLSEDDLRIADETLVDLIGVGFKVDFLKKKLNEVSEKKTIELNSKARLQTMEAQLQKLKLMFLDLDSQLQKEKAVVLAARAPLSFNDVVG